MEAAARPRPPPLCRRWSTLGGTRDIKQVSIYKCAHRIYTDLQLELGYTEEEKLNVNDVAMYDQCHFFGVNAVRDVIDPLKVTSESEILEIGSGLGGPTRVLSHLTGCHIDAIELQDDHHLIALDLTRRCGLEDKITHILGDVLDHTTDKKYDGLVSWLVFFHISEKELLFEKCFNFLKSGANIYIEDFFRRGEINRHDERLLRESVCGEDLPTSAEYTQALTDAGFTDVKFSDDTPSFVTYANEQVRRQRSRKIGERRRSFHGDRVYQQELNYHQVVADLLNKGVMGGCKIVATKP